MYVRTHFDTMKGKRHHQRPQQTNNNETNTRHPACSFSVWESVKVRTPRPHYRFQQRGLTAKLRQRMELAGHSIITDSEGSGLPPEDHRILP
jgi:hypothetical protein